MRYDIKVLNKPSNNESRKLVVYIDRVKELSIPMFITSGVGDKQKMYKKHLENTLFNPKDDQRLVKFLVQLHDKAIEMGGLEMICDCKVYNKWHGKVLKEIMEENEEILTSFISYLIPTSANKSMLDENKPSQELPEDLQVPSDMETMPPMTPMSKITLDNLNVPNADQLRALIVQDLENHNSIIEGEIVSKTTDVLEPPPALINI
jgi:hypothetical protein